VSGAIVDLLEVVAVDHEQAQRHAVLLGRLELALDALLEAAAVQNSCERIGDGGLPLAPRSDGGVERRGDVCGEDGRGIELCPRETLATGAFRAPRRELSGRAGLVPDDELG
jgi:hypothetical protein